MKTAKLSTRAKTALAGLGYENSPALVLLVAFAAQNPGLDWRDYGGDGKAYRSEGRSIQADWKRFLTALHEAAGEGVTEATVIAASSRAFSGRLEWKGDHWDYCTGQYFPTEYRKAAASVLEAAISDARQARPEKKAAAGISSISELKALHKSNGWHFFDRGAMAFFNSRIESGIIGGRYFITSERFNDDTPRKFTVRTFDERGSVDTLGEFCGHLDKESARDAIKADIKQAAVVAA